MNDIISLITLFLIVPYLIGSIPFGLILTRIFGYGDIRKIGSGNIGATNVMRTGNKLLGISTLILDCMKGFAAMIIPGVYSGLNIYLLSLADLYAIRINFFFVAALATLLGHIFPVWLKFKGGKGVATAIGVLLFLHPGLALNVITFWVITFLISRISSLAALCAFALTTLLSFFILFNDFFYNESLAIPMLIITLIIFFTHRENISRLIKGKESKWRKS